MPRVLGGDCALAAPYGSPRFWSPAQRAYWAGRPQPGLGSVASDIAEVVVQEALPYYRREIVRLDPWFERQGRTVGRAINEQIRTAVYPRVSRPSPPSSTPAWVGQVVDPVLTPFTRGVKAEVLPLVKEVAVGYGLLVFASGAFLGYLLGRR